MVACFPRGKLLLFSVYVNSSHLMTRAILHLFERLFLISWKNNRDCHITMPLSLKTMEVQIKGDE